MIFSCNALKSEDCDSVTSATFFTICNIAHWLLRPREEYNSVPLRFYKVVQYIFVKKWFGNSSHDVTYS